jgi:serine/threonine protein kinase
MEASNIPTEEIINERYRLLHVLGKGSVGITYAGIDLETEQEVAIKIVSLARVNNWKQIELLEREVQVLAQLNYPAIPKYLDYFQIESDRFAALSCRERNFYIVQQLAPGKSLFQLVENGWRTTGKQVKQIAIQILDILSYLHSLEPPIIHRDIKPQNLIRSDDGTIFLVDFGAVQNTYYNTFMKGSTVVGTYGYMAPEQFQGKGLPSTDLYGLGATILYLLTHRSPAELPQDTLKIDFRSRLNLSEEFADWLDKMLEPDAEDRFTSAEEALKILRSPYKIKTRSLIKGQRKIWLGLSIVVITLTLIINHYQWGILSRLGYYPVGLCDQAEVMNNYVNTGGKVIDDIISCLITLLETDRYYYYDQYGQSVNYNPKKIEKTIQLAIANKSYVNTKNGSGVTLLNIAVDKNYQDTVKRLIANGADVNLKDNQGQTPLFKAVVNAHTEIIKILISHGADIHIKDNYDINCLSIAAAKGDMRLYDIDNYFDNINNHNKKILLIESNKKYQEIVKSLIDQGADVNGKDTKYQPLLVAASKGDLNIIKILLAKGADLNVKNFRGETALFYASYSGYRDIVQFLITRGANVNAKDNDGETALFKAVHGHQKDIAEILINQGADINAKSNSGTTILEAAISTSDQNIVEFVRQKGAQ